MYIWALEEDVLSLLTDIRANDVWRYQIKIEKDNFVKSFIGLLEKTNQLTNQPEYYNTIFNNCTSSLYRDLNSILGVNLPYTSALLKLFSQESIRN